MSLSAPTKITVPWANSGTKNTIPVASQIGITPGAASWEDGFPPLTMTAKSAGGIPPAGPDVNGGLNAISSALQWLQAGAGYAYDSAFSTAVGGYPLSARVQRSDGQGLWINTTANNAVDPESSTTSGWLPLSNNATTAIAMTSSNVTLTALQAGAGIIYLSGALTANLNLVFPAWRKEWLVVNNCTGAFSVTCKTASGVGPVIATGTNAIIYGDGTNVWLATPSAGCVGQVRNLKASQTTASSTLTITADQVVLATALGSQEIVRPSLNKTLNIATTGAGGMDTGSVPASGYVAIYHIYNPTTQTDALLGVNATSAVAPNVYGGANMPSGYTASALLSVWPTNSSGQFIVGTQLDREIRFVPVQVLSTSTQKASLTSLDISSAVPPNAKSSSGHLQVGSTSSSNNLCQVASTSTGAGLQYCFNGVTASASAIANPFNNLLLPTPQNLYYIASASAGTMTFILNISGYSI